MAEHDSNFVEMKRGRGDFGMVVDSGKAVDPLGEHVGIGQLAARLNGATI